MEITSFFLWILALLVLGSVAAVGCLIRHAASNKKQSVGWTMTSVPLVTLLGLSILAVLLVLSILTLYGGSGAAVHAAVHQQVAVGQAIVRAGAEAQALRDHEEAKARTLRNHEEAKARALRDHLEAKARAEYDRAQVEAHVLDDRGDAGVFGVTNLLELWKEVNEPRIGLGESEGPQPAVTSNAPPSQDFVSLAMAKAVVELIGAVARYMGTMADSSEAAVADRSARVDVPDIEGRHTAPSEPRTQTAAVAPDADTIDTEVAELRPDWIDQPPKRVGNVWREVVVAGEYATVEECYAEADRLLKSATADHIKRLVEGRTGGAPVAVPPLEALGIGVDFIRREIATREHVETVQRSFGPMKKLYTQVEFSPSVDGELAARWESYDRKQRLATVGGGAGVLLSVIGAFYGLLKVDTWTKGYYTKRLFLGGSVVIISLVALLATLIR